ncbi:hypothetical protein [Nocardia abscessus]|nr:hypothetical protein [Nocardia abscessus]
MRPLTTFTIRPKQFMEGHFADNTSPVSACMVYSPHCSVVIHGSHNGPHP